MNSESSAKRGGLLKICLVSILAVAIVWGIFTWPLPLHFKDAIPSSSSSQNVNPVRAMIQGDHLQLLYYYWLNADMLTGGTPFFYDLYQFNTGDDEERRFVAFDQYPFVLSFLPGYLIGGRALGWNLMALVSMWITLVFTWCWIRLYSRRTVTAFLASLIALSLPYYWAMLMGGSPAGCAMAWAPMLLYGIELYLRRGSLWGGLWISLAVFLAFLNDAHVFFFGVLLGAGWGTLVFFTQVASRWSSLKNWGARICASLPIVVTAVIVFSMTYFKQQAIAESAKGGIRTWGEVALYSPKSYGLYTWGALGNESSIFIGYILMALLLGGLLWSLARFCFKPVERWRETLTHLALIVGIACIMALALGTYGPRGGRLIDLARRFLPPYGMIRQPAKIFTVIAPLLALGLWFPLERIYETLEKKRKLLAVAVAGMLSILVLAEQALQVRPQLCALDREQLAYKAVADDSRAEGVEPRAVILPIWPGESSWASIYQYYVSLYRIKMVNGYLPVVPETYVDGIFRPLEGMNTGMIGQDQLDLLASIGVRYVVLHEDAYPEKISCFPVGFALKRLLSSPNLKLLNHSGSVWAFKILTKPSPMRRAPENWDLFFPTLLFEFESATSDGAVFREDDSASAGAHIELPAGSSVTFPIIEHIKAADAVMAVRLKGRGKLRAEMCYDSGVTNVAEIAVENNQWEWLFQDMNVPSDSSSVQINLVSEQGSAALDMMFYAAGQVGKAYASDEVELPAALFFHAGYTDLEENAVVLRPEYEPLDYIFYGPRLPFKPGRYEIELDIDADAERGVRVGTLEFRIDGQVIRTLSVVAGEAARCEVDVPSNLPASIYFKYARNCTVRIHSLRWKRLSEGGK